VSSDGRLEAFDAAARRRSLERMAETELDVLVVGGGITGCGVALDAASRGLSVGLVERDDFASGTSGRSSRLVHGGMRYLAQRELRLVRESLRERAILLRLAPHLLRTLPIYVPRTGAVLRTGLSLYDVLAVGVNVARHRRVDADELDTWAPGMEHDGGGLVYYECATDDARLTLEVARAAAAHGALVANHARVDALLGDGRVEGARVRDEQSGETLEVRAGTTVNATGVWAGALQSLATDEPRRHVASKGVHLVFRPGAVRARAGALVPSADGDGRFVFVLPWDGRYYAGTTDTAYEGDLDDPAVDEADAAYVLAAVSQSFPHVNERCVVASWAGVRPLARGGDGATADLSRRHEIYETPAGLLTVTGGKLTTYRAMAEDVVDRLAPRTRSRTRELPLGLTVPLGEALARAQAAARDLGLADDVGRRLVHRYGDDWELALARIRQDAELARPVADDAPVLEVERVLAREREMALTDDDVDVRRTRLTTLGLAGLPSTTA
jgi:glycerol-3-phosphate dehydrogenase